MIGRRPIVLSILDLIPSRIGGIEVYLREFSQQLNEAGWDSVVYFPAPPSPVVRDYFDLPNLRVEADPGLFAGSRAANRHFTQALRRHSPAAVHLQFFGIPRLFPWLARLHGVRRFYYTDQASRPAGFQAGPGPLLRRVAARLAYAPVTARVSVSDYVNQCNIASGLLPPGRHVRIHNGVDPTRVPPAGAAAAFRERLRIPQDATVVVQVSSMIPEKGWDDLLDAAAAVLPRDPSVYLVCVGTGPLLDQYRQRAAALGFPDRILFTGASADPFTDGVFAAADVVCQVSRWEEAFGFTIAEAMAHGKPVVATRVGGIQELIGDGVCGRLVAREDPAAIAGAILELARDRILRERYGKAARERARESFDVRSLVADLLTLYGLPVARRNLGLRQP